VLGGIGRIDDARRLLERAVRLDPLNANTNLNYAYALSASGQFDSAVAIGRRLRDLDSASNAARLIVARAYRAKGDYAAAAAEFERANAPGSWRELVQVYTRLGRRREADSLRAALEQHAGAGGRYTDVFAAYLALGDKPSALRWLERAIDRHDGGIFNLRLFDSPDMKAARDDADFRRLIDRLGVNR
jgi:tetratricopeptide (TPR) repeat protein